MSFRYENYGTADLLINVTGTTVTGLDSSQAKFGSAFYQPTRTKCFDIPASPELWIKCDIYYTSSYVSGNRIRIYAEDSNGSVGWSNNSNKNTNSSIWKNSSNSKNISSTNFSANTKTTICLHIKSGKGNGLVEASFSNGATNSYTKEYINNGNDFVNVYIQMDGSNILVSNLIISDEEIGIDEDVAQPATVVETISDTKRLLTKNVTTTQDTCRNISRVQSLSIDTKREIVKTAIEKTDTLRDVASLVSVFNDTERIVEIDNSISAVTISDTLRKISNLVSNAADTLTDVKKEVQVFSSTERKTSKKIEVFSDTERKTVNNNIWRYENYGTTELLTVAGTTVIGLPISQAIYGSAFYQTQRVKCFDIPASKEIWIKCDIFHTGSANDRFRIYNDPTGSSANGICLQTDGKYNIYADSGDDAVAEVSGLQNSVRQTYLIHMVSDAANGVIEFWVDGIKKAIYQGNVNGGNNFSDIYFQSDNENNLFSNVIISNVEIGLDENVQGIILTLNADTCRVVTKTLGTFEVVSDTFRGVVRENQLIVDTQRELLKSQDINFDTLRNVIRPIVIKCDTARALPFWIIKVPEVSKVRAVYPIANVLSDTLRIKSRAIVSTFSDTEKLTTKKVEVLADTERKMPFRYENYGTAELMNNVFGDETTDYTDLPLSQSKTGAAFTTRGQFTFPIPATKELWAKFDLYAPAVDWYGVGWSIFVADFTSYLEDIRTPKQFYIDFLVDEENNQHFSFNRGTTASEVPLKDSNNLNDDVTITTVGLITVLLHATFDSENGLIELWIGNKKYCTEAFSNEGLIYKGNLLDGTPVDFVEILKTGNDYLLSNVIISSEEIQMTEIVNK